LGDAVARSRDDRQKDLLRPALEAIIDLGHPLVRLAGEIDWGFLDRRFASVCTPGPGQPGLPTRLVAGLFILKHMHNLSDEMLCARWLENPYYQFFCGELSFCHRLPFDRSSLMHWRQRLGEEQLVALIQESLSVAHKTGALATRDLERVLVDTTVQPKAIAHPTDARLCHRALEKLVDLARRHDVALRQSYRRVAKRAAIMVGRYTHAHQFKRARRQLKFLRIRLGRVIRDIRRKSIGKRLVARLGDVHRSDEAQARRIHVAAVLGGNAAGDLPVARERVIAERVGRGDADHAEIVFAGQPPARWRHGAHHNSLGIGLRIGRQMQSGADQRVPVGLFGHGLAAEKAQDHIDALGHAIALYHRVDAEHQRIGGEQPRPGAKHDAPFCVMIELHNAIRGHQRVVVQQ
jgi:hypothetical protein